jgi:hypothetical protein
MAVITASVKHLLTVPTNLSRSNARDTNLGSV